MERNGWEKRLVITKAMYEYTIRLFEKSKTSGGCTEAEIAALPRLVEMLLDNTLVERLDD